jgi:hypothetical protein
MIELEPIHDIHPDVWDRLIADYSTRLLFHQSAWLDFLEETQKGRILRFRILQKGATEGYFTGLLVRKGFFKILGSPLIGWKTDHMGPVVNPRFDMAGFINALDDTCRAMGVHLVQVANPQLDPAIMRHMGYDRDGWMVMVVPLSHNEESMWKAISGKCRNRIRKGLEHRLTVEDWNGPGFEKEYYSQLVEVFAKQRARPYYSLEMVRSLLKHLGPDHLKPLCARFENNIVATGIFVYDDRHVYSFGSSSRTEFQKLYPNELLFWTVMTHFGKQGKKDFCIGANYRTPETGGVFKEKFKGHQEPVYRYTKCYSMLARAGREFHKYSYRTREWIKQRLPV